MVLASMTMTAEYRSGMIRTTFIATPNRHMVLVAKAVVVSAFSAVFAALMVVGAVVVARLFTTSSGAANLSLTVPEMWRLVGAVALYAALAAVLGVGVGALLRARARRRRGAVAVAVGRRADAGQSARRRIRGRDRTCRSGTSSSFTEVPWLYPTYAMPWGPVGSLVYFAVIVAAVFVRRSSW